LHWGVNPARAALAFLAIAVAALLLVSGGSGADPRTPPALPGLPPPFLGTAVVGTGELTAAIDAYGDVVDLRPSPAGQALIANPSQRQAAGTVPADTGIVPKIRIGGGAALPLWRANSVRQRYAAGTNVLVTMARLGGARTSVTVAARASSLALAIRVRGGGLPMVSTNVEAGVRCTRERRAGQLDVLCRVGRTVPAASGAAAGGALAPGAAARPSRTEPQIMGLVRHAAAGDRRWLVRARPLGPGAPSWARRMYRRSLLTLRALTGTHTGAVAAGARDGWAYVWPRDAATVALALEAAGYRSEARSVARFLGGLHLGAAARFEGDGRPVPGRGRQGDAPGWTAAAARATGVPLSPAARPSAANPDLTEAPDYQEGAPGDYLANALSRLAKPKPQVDGPKTRLYGRKSAHQPGAPAILARFGTVQGLVRRAGDPESGLDSAAAWAVRPFARPALFGAARETLTRLLTGGTKFGITPGAGWSGGDDPWTAPTAWSAWSLAALARHEAADQALARAGGDDPALAHEDRRRALHLLADLRRAATPAGELPERADARTGAPRSTTPLAWSHAFAVLALRELWPAR
jgi:glucoamylase